MIFPTVPPSKSLTHRTFVAAALACGTCQISNPLYCDDTDHTRNCLQELGAKIENTAEGVTITGTDLQKKENSQKSLYAGDSGTTARFIGALLAAQKNENGRILDGSKQLRNRPFADLQTALSGQNVQIDWLADFGQLPCRICSTGLTGGQIFVPTQKSSQFLSALLLVSPLAQNKVLLQFEPDPVSWPYVELTLAIMRGFGICVESRTNEFCIQPQKYQPQNYTIENDWSAAAFFAVAGAIGKKAVCLKGLQTNSLQADAKIITLLQEMGAKIEKKSGDLIVYPSQLFGITADMKMTPDLVPIVAVAAACAKTPSRLTNISHLRHKESNRITAIATALRSVGTQVQDEKDSLTIYPKPFHTQKITIKTRDDHRIAMSMSILSLAACDIHLDNPDCIKKSFPQFQQERQKFS